MTPRPLFGVAGNPPNFWASKFRKERANAPEWLKTNKLDALEIQCTHGVRMPDSRALAFRENSRRFGIFLSIHGPYYISLGSSDSKKIENSLNELRKCVELAKKIGSSRVIFHLGAIEHSREESRANAILALRRFEESCDLGGVQLFPEVSGKIKQLGSFEDLLEISHAVACTWPCLDLAHLHACTHGSLNKPADFERLFDEVEIGRVSC